MGGKEVSNGWSSFDKPHISLHLEVSREYFSDFPVAKNFLAPVLICLIKRGRCFTGLVFSICKGIFIAYSSTQSTGLRSLLFGSFVAVFFFRQILN